MHLQQTVETRDHVFDLVVAGPVSAWRFAVEAALSTSAGAVVGCVIKVVAVTAVAWHVTDAFGFVVAVWCVTDDAVAHAVVWRIFAVVTCCVSVKLCQTYKPFKSQVSDVSQQSRNKLLILFYKNYLVTTTARSSAISVIVKPSRITMHTFLQQTDMTQKSETRMTASVLKQDPNT